MARKFVPFEDIEQLATIEQLAEMLSLSVQRNGRQLRCVCPVHGGDERTIAISPEVRSRRGSLGVFYCQKGQSGGDRISLVAHCMELGQQDAALFIAQQFGAEISTENSTGKSTGTGTVKCNSRATVPPEQKGGANRPTKTEQAFDPVAFAAKLVFSEEVAALGFSEEDAEHFGVGSTGARCTRRSGIPAGTSRASTTTATAH
jgi:hypothetical protein